MSDPGSLAGARSLLAGPGPVCVLTGAGVSAESGVPTFRGPEGLWRSYRPEELATPAAFARAPELVWEWYSWRRGRVAACRPNPAHEALAALGRRRGDVTLATQNVDGLHALAGTREPLELHGNLFRVRCTRCRFRAEHPREALPPPWPPRCPECRGALRPDVVWFGEALPSEELSRGTAAARACRVFLVVGTSGVVHPAAGLAFEAKSGGAAVIEVNPEATPLSEDADLVLRGKAGEVLPQVLAP
ncbi:MAG: NAD-dependent deacylase [Planctomycetales bacterium]|nr:NAD-dependent deacylase [Planctomycetales bacterium]